MSSQVKQPFYFVDGSSPAVQLNDGGWFTTYCHTGVLPIPDPDCHAPKQVDSQLSLVFLGESLILRQRTPC